MGAMSESNTFKVRPLTTGNYFIWRDEMEDLLVVKDLWDAVVESAAFVADTQKEAKSKKARAFLRMSMAEKLRGLIPRDGTAKEAWDAIEKHCLARADDRKTDLHRQLASIAQGSGEKMAEFILRAEGLRRELKDGCKENVSDAMMIGIILNGVASGYGGTIEALRCQSALTLEILTEKLIAAESRSLDDGAVVRALPVHGSAESMKNDPIKKKDSRRCFRCGQVGHLIARCPQKRKQKNDVHDNARCLAISPSSHWGRPFSLLLDTCASYHMCAREECFDQIVPSSIHTVHAGGGEAHDVVGKGVVTFQTEFGTVTLHGVLFVPTLKANLCSWPAASRMGATMHAVGPDVLVSNSRGDPLFLAEVVDSLLTVQGDLDVNKSSVAVACAVSAEVWHKRLGHASAATMSSMSKGAVRGMHLSGAIQLSHCDACFEAKQTRLQFEESNSLAKYPLELVHADVIGKIAAASLGGAHYVLSVMYDCTRFSAVVCLASKAQVADAFIRILREWERQTGRKTKAIRTDNGTEFKGALTNFCEKQGVIHQTSVRYTPQQNGRAERVGRVLFNKARSMLFDADLPTGFWAEGVSTANFVRNVTYSRVVKCTPYEMFFGKKPDVSMLRVFGCKAFVHVPKEKRGKLDKRSVRGVFVGYEPHCKGWRVLYRDGTTWCSVVSRDVVFDESCLGVGHIEGASDVACGNDYVLLSLDGVDEENATYPAPAAPEDAGNAVGDNTAADVHTPTDDGAGHGAAYGEAIQDRGVRRSSRVRAEPARYADEFPARVAAVGALNLTDEPQSLKEVQQREDWQLWEASMHEEYAALRSKGVFTEVDLPDDVKALPCRWVYKIKRDQHGKVEKYKSRVVAKGYLQRNGINGELSSENVFAPASNITTLRVLLSLAAQEDFDIDQLDVKTAFLNGDLEEEVYMKCPPGFYAGGKVWRLRKALYGLRQAANAWHRKLKESLLGAGFSLSTTDPCLYMIKFKDATIFVLVHVDDCLVVGTRAGVMHAKDLIKSLFDVKDLGAASTFLGLDVLRDRASRTLWLGQPRYVQSMLEQFNLVKCNPRVAPFDTGTQLTREGDVLGLDVPYSALVGSLLYLATNTRPDISHAVGMLSRFVASPRVEHWQAAKSVLRYLAGTHSLGRLYGDRTQPFVGYSDSDFAGNTDARYSTSGCVFMFGGAAVAWRSKLQSIVATSTCEAELVAAAQAVKEALYFGKLLTDLCGVYRPITVCVDNQPAIVLLRNPAAGSHNRTKHVDICYHFARHRVAIGDVKIEYIATTQMLADLLTKQLSGPVFRTHRSNLGLCERP
jgi:Reverse transcriptase (RNA-dependent DNA polymerase)/gag-polypeptide of LTR copia-type/Integrase core domain/GAG-pre-integrase domain/Zinc knuckle